MRELSRDECKCPKCGGELYMYQVETAVKINHGIVSHWSDLCEAFYVDTFQDVIPRITTTENIQCLSCGHQWNTPHEHDQLYFEILKKLEGE